MGLNIFTSAEGAKLQKRYTLKDGGIKSAFRPGTYFRPIKNLEVDCLEQIQNLYKRANTENLALTLSKPRGNTATFRKTKEAMESQDTRVLVKEIEWSPLSDSPQSSDCPEKHLHYILSRLGFSNPNELEAYIVRSSSCGLEGYKPETYRFHVYLLLTEKINQEELAKSLRRTFGSLLDYSVYEPHQMLCLQQGIFDSGVVKPQFEQMDFYQPGRSIALQEIEQIRLDPELEKEHAAKNIAEDVKKTSQAWEAIQKFFPHLKRAELSKIDGLKRTLERMSHRTNGKSYLDGKRNYLLFFYIRQALLNVGDASEIIDFICKHKDIRGDWTRHDLERKAIAAWSRLKLHQRVGGVEAHFDPHRVVQLDEKNISKIEDISQFPLSGRVLLNTPEGSGKTNLILGNWLNEWKRINANAAPRILYVCFRRAVLSQVSLEFGLDNYETVGKDEAERTGLSARERKERFCRASNNLAICNRSLRYLAPGGLKPEQYDIVILDEIEALLDDIFLNIRLGDTEEEAWISRDKQFELLKRICRQANLVIGADASASGLMSGWFMDLIAQEGRDEKVLIRNDADYIADKEIRLQPSLNQALKDIADCYHRGEVISVHTGFGNNETQTMRVCRNVLIALGVPEEAIGLYYPKALDEWEEKDKEKDPNAPTYRSNPDAVIAGELEKGIKVFFNSPGLGVGWSVKLDEFSQIVGLFNSTIFSATWIKQFVRRVRLAPKISVFIPGWQVEPPLLETEELLREVLEDHYLRESFSHCQARAKLKQLLDKQSIRHSFSQLLEEAGASYYSVDEVSDEEKEKLKRIWKKAKKHAIEAHMDEDEQLRTCLSNFVYRDGKKLEPHKLGTQDKLDMCLWVRHRGEQIHPLLEIWDNPEKASFLTANWMKVQTLMWLVLREIDELFKNTQASDSFLDWLLDTQQESAVFWTRGREESPQTKQADLLIKKHAQELQQTFFPQKEAANIYLGTLLQELGEILYLNVFIDKKRTLKAQGFDLLNVRESLRKDYKIPKSVKVGSLNEMLFEKLMKKTTRLTRVERAFLQSHFEEITLLKRFVQPRALDALREQRFEDSVKEAFNA